MMYYRLMTNFIRIPLFSLALLTLAGCRAEPPDALSSAPTAEEGAQVAQPAAVAHPTAGGATGSSAPADHEHAQPMANEGMAAPPGVGSDAPFVPPTEGGLPTVPVDEPKTTGRARGIEWAVPQRWPLVGEEDEFRVRTWRLPAMTMAGAGECVLYRFPGGGDPQANLQRWMGQFRGPDGTVESVHAEQAQRVIQGLPAWLVRAQGTYVSQGQSMEGPEEEFENYALFGAVVIPEGDPAFVKCTGPVAVIAHEADAIFGLIDSLLVEAN